MGITKTNGAGRFYKAILSYIRCAILKIWLKSRVIVAKASIGNDKIRYPVP
jgi:hypothetical protein